MSSQHRSIWSEPARSPTTMPPIPVAGAQAPLAAPAPEPQAASTSTSPAAVPTGDVFADAVQELKERMELEKIELQRVRESVVSSGSSDVTAGGSSGGAGGHGPDAGAHPPAARRASATATAPVSLHTTDEDLQRMQQDKERVERQEREVRSRLDERLKRMQAEAMRYEHSHCNCCGVVCVTHHECLRALCCAPFFRLNSIRQELACVAPITMMPFYHFCRCITMCALPLCVQCHDRARTRRYSDD